MKIFELLPNWKRGNQLAEAPRPNSFQEGPLVGNRYSVLLTAADRSGDTEAYRPETYGVKAVCFCIGQVDLLASCAKNDGWAWCAVLSPEFAPEGTGHATAFDAAVPPAPDFKTKKDALAWFKTELASNEALAYDALLTIFAMQTADEQAWGATTYNNGVGFTGLDAEILSSFAKQLEQRRESKGAAARLSAKQVALLFKKMPKYARQYMQAGTLAA